jgi:hypothetical protein
VLAIHGVEQLVFSVGYGFIAIKVMPIPERDDHQENKSAKGNQKSKRSDLRPPKANI